VTDRKSRCNDFLALSVALTGYTKFRLRGTGQADLYFSTLTDVAGEAIVDELLGAFRGVRDSAREDAARFERLMRIEILSDEKLGPIARNVIKLWYIGTWYQLPPEWRERFGASARDRTFVPSPAAFTEGLLWPTIGANPSGAKAPGYAIWTGPPRIAIK
jgi:hypothetical protein